MAFMRLHEITVRKTSSDFTEDGGIVWGSKKTLRHVNSLHGGPPDRSRRTGVESSSGEVTHMVASRVVSQSAPRATASAPTPCAFVHHAKQVKPSVAVRRQTTTPAIRVADSRRRSARSARTKIIRRP